METATLRKILELEQQKDYRDVAVVGGLDRLLKRGVDGLPDKLGNVSYFDMDAKQRGEWVGGMLHWLDMVDAKAAKGAALKADAGVANRKNTPVRSQSVSVKDLDAPITVLRGVSDKLAQKFRRLGVQTVRDMLYFFPRRHIDYSKRKSIAELQVGEEQTVVANIWQASQVYLGGRRSAEAVIGDESGNMKVVWFNQPYLAKQFHTNAQYIFSGRVSLYKGVKMFVSPEYEPMAGENTVHTGRLIPVYPLTEGLGPRMVRRLTKETVESYAPLLKDYLPQGIRESAGLIGLSEAVLQAHYPQDERSKDTARRRLAFDELFIIQLGVLSRRKNWRESGEANRIESSSEVLDMFTRSLPFTMTHAQFRKDFRRSH